MTLSKEQFPDFLEAVIKSYSSDFSHEFPSPSDFPDHLFVSGKLEFPLLEEFSQNNGSSLMKSLCDRMLAIEMLRKSRDEGTELDINSSWKLVSQSITEIPLKYTISSIGSQGFLSIPLFKSDKEHKSFEFIRLHIWADSLNEFMDVEACERLSIHTHSFYAKSWAITGQVINDRYSVITDGKGNGYSLFDVRYNASLNNVNQHSSVAVNSGKNVIVKLTVQEVHNSGSTYDIAAGDFHRSGHLYKDGVSATFFSFTAKDGLAEKSYVVGPSNVPESLINRKMSIDPAGLIAAIHQQLNIKP